VGSARVKKEAPAFRRGLSIAAIFERDYRDRDWQNQIVINKGRRQDVARRRSS
jgi:hypothetical protein